MDLIKADQPTNRRRGNCRRNAIAIIAFATIITAIYVASVWPVFAINLKSEGILSNGTLRKMYRPLFHIAPELTCSYLRQFGVSDIETFFVMQASKGESR